MVRVTPKHHSLPAWIEANVRLPAAAAEPGAIRLYPYQRGIADAIANPQNERVTVLKSARVGYTAVMTAALAHFVVRELQVGRDPRSLFILEICHVIDRRRVGGVEIRNRNLCVGVTHGSILMAVVPAWSRDAM
jgi:hypothetical protein